MSIYSYKAVNQSGQIVKDKITAQNRINCIKKIKEKNLSPISVEEVSQKKNDFFTFCNRISEKDVRIFTQNLLLLKKANFNNVNALKTIIENTQKEKMKAIINEILDNVEKGNYIYMAMEKHPEIFQYIYVNMIKIGELSGTLEKSLSQAIEYLEKNESLKNKIRKIVLPNVAMFIAILIILIICTVLGVPAIQSIFDSVGSNATLPKITLWFSDTVNYISANWKIITGIILLIIIAIVVYIKTQKGRYRLDKLKYNMPIFGELIFSIDFSRLLRNVLLNVENDSRIQESLEVSKNVVKNKIMLEMVNQAIENIYLGKSWVEPFEKQTFSNKIALDMLKIGMQTDLSEMMNKLLEYMEKDIDDKLERVTKILPEVAYSFVGIILIFFVVVIIVPCVQLYMGDFLVTTYLE